MPKPNCRYTLRYILEPKAKLNDPIGHHELYAANVISKSPYAIRIAIPPQVKLVKMHPSLRWWTTMDHGTIADFRPTAMVLIDGKWTERPDLLAKCPMGNWTKVLDREGYVMTEAHGFVDKASCMKHLVELPDGRWKLY